MKKIAINGMGRIGRAALKVILDTPEFDLVAVNDIVSIENIAYLIKYDSVYGIYEKEVSHDENTTPGYVYFDLAINSYPINVHLLNIQIFAGVENIFNTSYKSHLSTYRGINLTEPGRNIYAKVKLSWWSTPKPAYSPR